MFVAFSVTTSWRPFGLNSTCAGSGAAVLSGRVEPGSGTSLPQSARKPRMFAGVVAFPAFRT